MFGFKKIKSKLFLAFLLFIVMVGVVGTLSYSYLTEINRYQSYKDQVDQLHTHTLEVMNLQSQFLNDDSKNPDFMRIGKSQIITELEFAKKETIGIILKLQNEPVTQEFGFAKKIGNIEELNENYFRVFEVLKERVKFKGLKNIGLEGEMRQHAHKLEKIAYLDQDNETIDNLLLTLRRHEKDFIIRKDLSYVTKLHQTASILINSLPETIENQEEVLAIVSGYEQYFDKLVSVEKEIGFTKTTGLRGKLNIHQRKINTEIAAISSVINMHNDRLVQQAQIIIASTILLFVIIGAILMTYYSRKIAQPIVKLDKITQSVAEGDYEQEDKLDKLNTGDEVGDLAQNFKVVLTKMKTSLVEVDEKNLQLAEFAKEEAKRNWASDGISNFNPILTSNNDNLQKQSFEIISTLVRYTSCIQGAIFIVNNDGEEPVLEITSAYACDREKFLKGTTAYGEGLVGSVWREGTARMVTDIPDGYAKIKSGSGERKPNFILFVPIKNDDKIEGILELVAFKEIEQYKIDFIEKISERIATTISAVKANIENAKLLDTTQNIAQKLQHKEAELKKQIDKYETYLKEFEDKLEAVAEEAHVYQTVINRVYEGIILTNERFIITKVNQHILDRFKYTREELEGKTVDVLIETEYANIIDLKERKFQLSYKSFTQNVSGKVIDQAEHIYPVEMMSGKLEIDSKIVYVFLFNEMNSAKKSLENIDMDDNFFSLN